MGDKIKLYKSQSGETMFIGFVHAIETSRVLLSLPRGFKTDVLYNVEFVANRIPFRRMHQALDLAPPPARLLYPSSADVADPGILAASDISPLDVRLHQNDAQRRAVTSIINLPASSAPFLVFGPYVLRNSVSMWSSAHPSSIVSPGTGKTVVVVESVMQLLARNPSARVLACAPSNAAADEIAQRLAAAGLSTATLLRLNASSRITARLPEDLKQYSCLSPNSRNFELPTVDELKGFRVVVSTCISSTLLFGTGVPRGHYSHIFVDEAGHALEPEALVPSLGLADVKTNIVLSGDPKQLGPIVRSQHAAHFGFGQSLLERLMNSDLYDSDDGKHL